MVALHTTKTITGRSDPLALERDPTAPTNKQKEKKMTNQAFETRDRMVSSLTFARDCIEKLLKDWPADKRTYQSAPTDNHAIWILGHLAVTDVWLLGSIGIKDNLVPDTYEALFGYGSIVKPDAEEYPSFDEVKGYFDSVRAKLTTWLAEASPEDLMQSTKEASGGFFDDILDGLKIAAWHEGWHAGQLSSLRRAIGLGPALV